MLQGLFELRLVLKQSGVQPHEKALLIGAHALGEVLLHGQFAQQRPLFFHPLGGAGQRGLQVLGGQVEFYKVIHHPGPHGLLDVVKLFKAGQHNESGQRAPLPAGAGQRQAVHQGHFYVGHHNIRLFTLDEFQRQLAVAGCAADSVAQLFPFQHSLQADEHQRLIIHK